VSRAARSPGLGPIQREPVAGCARCPASRASATASRTTGRHFTADWLRQREPFDAIAREAAASRLKLRERLALLRDGTGMPLCVIDLACGTGANLRWLAPRLGGEQQWLAVDHDAALLRRWPACLAAASEGSFSTRRHTSPQKRTPLATPLRFHGLGFDAAVIRRRLDLARDLERLPWQAAQLVTASAFLDLVSFAWLQRLVEAVVSARVTLSVALTVDGRHVWSPRDADDGEVGALFAAHQHRDKGFHGAALGADAGSALEQALRAAGYRVHIARSDWRLDGRDASARALMQALITGIAAAAQEQQPRGAALVQAWRQRRLVQAARGTLRVGHIDVLAVPPP
jgi:SAM-dependent methyltransferase